jgi:hypothetical protein
MAAFLKDGWSVAPEWAAIIALGRAGDDGYY